ncbi:18625_t:CDS:2 [Racocetra persica]|uniref:18625_t:CDS:1 n=1 Tax=Racocetra persica TaxID=160502 RepID=A0ACA9KI67_9GLOM|nr:18625_t:CDS:2 [Racocetra persica]
MHSFARSIYTNEEHIQLGVIMSEMLIEQKPLGSELFDTDLILTVIYKFIPRILDFASRWLSNT